MSFGRLKKKHTSGSIGHGISASSCARGHSLNKTAVLVAVQIENTVRWLFNPDAQSQENTAASLQCEKNWGLDELHCMIPETVLVL